MTETKLTRARVLIVDDDVAFCNLVDEILRPKGYEVVKACSVPEAEAVLSEQVIDLILLDIVMPGESGMKYLERMDQDESPIPLVMVTGHPQMETAVNSIKHGASDYLTKPLTPEQLLNTVQKSLEDRALVRDLEGTVVMGSGVRYIAGYQIKRTLGEGNMGIVYLVEGKDTMGNTQEYAMKVLKPLVAEDEDRLNRLKKRFLVEARAAFSIQHPNIVQIYDYGTNELNMPYILMEYCPGQTLDLLIESDNLSMTEKCRILRQIAFALDSIHDNDICHRDIKPANIIVDGDLHTKLTDFGIARLRDSNLTMTSEIFGTPAYLAPESFTSAKVSYHADIFSMGSVAYELFCGQRAFDGPTIGAISRQIKRYDPLSLRKMNKDFPKEIDAMVRKMLEKEPANRYQSAFEVYLELTAYMDKDQDQDLGERSNFFKRLIGRG